MRINPNTLSAIAIDKFVSTSGRYLCFLAEAYKPDMRVAGKATLRWYEFVACTQDGRVIKKVSLGGERREAIAQWEEWKAQFTAKFDGEEEKPDEWIELKFHNHKWTQREADLLKIRPIGARLFLRMITPSNEVKERAEAVGLVAVTDAKNQPPATMGLVIRVGSDPFIAELARPGDVILCSKHAGSEFIENGQVYRQIELHEIQGVRKPEDGFDDLNLSDPANEAVVRDLSELQAAKPATATVQ